MQDDKLLAWFTESLFLLIIAEHHSNKVIKFKNIYRINRWCYYVMIVKGNRSLAIKRRTFDSDNKSILILLTFLFKVSNSYFQLLVFFPCFNENKCLRKNISVNQQLVFQIIRVMYDKILGITIMMNSLIAKLNNF